MRTWQGKNQDWRIIKISLTVADEAELENKEDAIERMVAKSERMLWIGVTSIAALVVKTNLVTGNKFVTKVNNYVGNGQYSQRRLCAPANNRFYQTRKGADIRQEQPSYRL